MSKKRFEIGEQVRLKFNLSNGKKKGQIFTIRNIRTIDCGCWLIDIGFSTINKNFHCQHNNNIKYLCVGIDWIHYEYVESIKEKTFIKQYE